VFVIAAPRAPSFLVDSPLAAPPLVGIARARRKLESISGRAEYRSLASAASALAADSVIVALSI